MSEKLRRWALTAFVVFLIVFMIFVYTFPSLTGF